MEREDMVEESESLNEGTLKSIVRSILLRHKRKRADEPSVAEEHSKEPDEEKGSE